MSRNVTQSLVKKINLWTRMLQMKYLADQRFYELYTTLKFFYHKICDRHVFYVIVVNRVNDYNREKF